jgi:phosphatidylethanolamine-binding protein (PEBP) family uncharacterized protein
MESHHAASLDQPLLMALRHGINDFTKWFSADAQMAGRYYGYDGPAPPWNDAIVHHYVFTLYALDIQHLQVKGELTGPNVRAALAGHVLAAATLTGTYSLKSTSEKAEINRTKGLACPMTG